MDADDDLLNEGCQDTVSKLRSVVNDINIFTNPNECVDFLTDIDDQKVFMIIAESTAEQLLSLINEIPQLDSIYIFCANKSPQKQWVIEWPKIKGVYTEIIHICEALQLAVNQCNQDSTAISFINVDEKTLNQNLDQLEPSFMYTQIFKEILLEMEHDEQSIKDLIVFCRQQYVGNTREINIIDEFARDYRLKSPIWWYTRECFTYQMLNRALRTMDGEIIIMMGFFIRELHCQIEQLHQQQLNSYHGQPFTVYRGQGLSETDFDKLLKTKGGLMSFNNFLSTSKKREVSFIFAKNASARPDMTGILFKMSINPTISSTSFADVREASYYKKEEEVLFSMHTVFRIGTINKVENINPLYEVELKLTADDDQQLRTLTNHIREETDGSGWERMGNLLVKMGQFNKAKELCKILLHQTSDDDEKSLYYNQLGIIKDSQGDYEDATLFHKKSLEFAQKNLSPSDPYLAASYNNLAVTYYNMGEYSKALLSYEKALDILQKTLSPIHSSVAASYNNVGGVCQSMGDYSKALSSFEMALEIWQKTLPANHPDLATSHNNIAAVYSSMGEHSKALSFYEKVVEIYRKTLPPNHPSLAMSYNNIGDVHRNMGEYSKALSSFEMALEIWQKTLPSNHPSLAASYNNIATIYYNTGEQSKALSFYEKALDIFQKTLFSNHPSLAMLYNNVGEIHRNMGEYEKALSFYEKALEIYQKTLPSNHPSLATLYNNIGTIHYSMQEHSKALLFYEKALVIYQKTLPANHPSLAMPYNNIAAAYCSTGKQSKALSFYEKALDIYKKTLPANHPDFAMFYNNVAAVYHNMKEYTKALSYYEKAFEIYQKMFSENHPMLATICNNIGAVYADMREYSKSISFYERALDILQNSFSSNHPHIKITQRNIDVVRKKM